MKTCTNAYCGTDRQAYSDCVYERRATPNDPWVVEKTVSDERITGLAPEECLVGGSGKPLGGTFTLEAVTVCYD